MRILAGETVVRGRGSPIVAHFAPGFVSHLRDLVSDRVGHNAGGAEVITEQEVERATRPHGDALGTSVIVFGDSRAGQLVVVADEVGGQAVDGGGQDEMAQLVDGMQVC